LLDGIAAAWVALEEMCISKKLEKKKKKEQRERK